MPRHKQPAGFDFAFWVWPVAAGLASAALFLATAAGGQSPFLLILNIFSPLPLLLAGLAGGFSAASLAGLIATGAVILSEGAPDWLKYFLFTAWPSALAAFLYFYKPGKTGLSISRFIRVFTFYGLFLCPLWILIYRHLPAFGDNLQELIAKIYQRLGQEFQYNGQNLESLIPAEEFYRLVIPYYTGLTVLNALLLLTLNGAIALWVFHLSRKSTPPAALEISQYHLPVTYSYGFIGLLALQIGLSTAGAYLLGGFWLVLFFPLTLNGLALCHRWIQQRKGQIPWLPFFYLFFALLLPYSFLGVSILGLVEPLITKTVGRLHKKG